MKRFFVTLAVIVTTAMIAQANVINAGRSQNDQNDVANTKVLKSKKIEAEIVSESHSRARFQAGGNDTKSQEYLVIEKGDGSLLKVEVDNIVQMYFELPNTLFGKVADAVDLGLSVKWASWDVGASKIGEYGGLFGWADPSGEKTSKEYSDYPTSSPPSDICGTEYDIAHVAWGGDWRLPTYEEIKELSDECKWYRAYLNGDSCIEVVGPNGNSIILPFAGARYGTESRNPKNGYFWSGTLYQDDTKYAWGLIVNHDKYSVSGLNRVWGRCVRPVFGEKAVPASLSVSPSELTLGSKKGSSGSITIDSNTEWSITGIPSWLSASATSGKGDATITLTTNVEYEGADDRTAETITVQTKSGGKTANVKVSQKGVGIIFNVSSTSVSLANTAGAEGSFTVNTNAAFTITNNADWLEVSPKSGSTTTKVTVKALTANPTSSERQATVSISNALIGSYRVTVTQAAGTQTIIYREPYITWGASKSQVKSYMSDYTIYREENDALAYTGKYKEALIVYSFQDGKLNQAAVVVSSDNTTLEALDAQLKKNSYSYVGISDGAYFYLSADEKTGVAVSYDSEAKAYYIYYFEVSGSSATVFYEEPYTTWGTSRSIVRSTVLNSGYTIMAESSKSSDYYYLVLNPKNKEVYTEYLFDSSKKLARSSVYFDTSVASIDDLRTYVSSTLSHSFKGTNAAGDQFFYLTKDGKSYAIVRTNKYSDGTQLNCVSYVDVSSVSTGTRERARGQQSSNLEDNIVYECDAPEMLNGANRSTIEQPDLKPYRKVGEIIRNLYIGLH